MARTSTFPLYDRIVGGTLTAKLRAWRTEGLTFEDMAFRLRTEHDVTVSSSTVHRWVDSLTAADDAGDAA